MSYFEAWRRFCDFTGKTDRSQYWAALFTHFFVYTFLMLALTVGLVIWSGLSDEAISVATKVVLAIYNLAFLVPCIAMTVRRLRDAGYSAKSFFCYWFRLLAESLFLPACAQSAVKRKILYKIITFGGIQYVSV